MPKPYFIFLISVFIQRFQIIIGHTNIETVAVHDEALESVGLAEHIQCGGELEFTAFTVVVFDVCFQMIEDFRFDDVLAEYSKEFIAGVSGDA